MSTPLRERPDAPLGTLIFRAGLLPAETIESALQESSRTGKRLGEILLDRKLLEEAELSRLLAGQKGLPFVSLREQGVDVDAAKLFTEDQARLYRALPFDLGSGSPVVAISDPTNDVVMRNIREALDGADVQFAVATKSELTELMAEVYNPNGNGTVMNGTGTVANGNGAVANGTGYVANGNGASGNGASPVAAIEPEPQTEPEAITEPEPEAVSEALPDPQPHIVSAPPAAVAAEPAAEPAPAVHPAPAAAAEPAPPEPAVVEPAQVGFAPEPMPAPAPLRVAASPEPVPLRQHESAAPATVRVVIRLSNNDRVEAAVVGDPSTAKAQAMALIRYIAGKDGSDWPYIGGRFLKPDAILSVDLVEQDAGEGGSRP